MSFENWFNDSAKETGERLRRRSPTPKHTWVVEEGARCRYFGDAQKPCDGHYDICFGLDAYLECAECGHRPKDDAKDTVFDMGGDDDSTGCKYCGINDTVIYGVTCCASCGKPRD